MEVLRISALSSPMSDDGSFDSGPRTVARHGLNFLEDTNRRSAAIVRFLGASV